MAEAKKQTLLKGKEVVPVKSPRCQEWTDTGIIYDQLAKTGQVCNIPNPYLIDYSCTLFRLDFLMAALERGE
jgi:hypothetical protein